MKHIIAIAALTATCSFTPVVQASEGGSCHFHGNAPAKEATVVGCSTKQRDALVKKGKLDSTWQAVPLDKVEKVEGKDTQEWKLSFKNPAAIDKTKETLYMFYTLPGNFIGANFTGK